MFAPVQQDIYPLIEPREMDRFVSSTQIRNNELPFEQIQVGHGLNDGYTARPTGGFHNPLRIFTQDDRPTARQSEGRRRGTCDPR